MCIVTGPRIDLAIALIDRMKGLFRGKGLPVFDICQMYTLRSLEEDETS
jgi:hypothetical protein